MYMRKTFFKNTVKNISQSAAGYGFTRKDRKIYYPPSLLHSVKPRKHGRYHQGVCQHGKQCGKNKMLFAQTHCEIRGNKRGKRTEDYIPYNGICQKIGYNAADKQPRHGGRHKHGKNCKRFRKPHLKHADRIG